MQSQRNKWIYFGVVMIAGALCGSMLLQTLPTVQQDELQYSMSQYIGWMKQLVVTNEPQLFWDVWIKHLKWAIAVILLGISLVGVPLVVVINFLKGFLLGGSIYVLIQSFQEEGIWLAIFTLVPQNIIAIPALIILSSTSISFSSFILKKRIIKHEGVLKDQLIQMSTISTAMILVLALAACVEVYISPQILQWYLSQS